MLRYPRLSCLILCLGLSLACSQRPPDTAAAKGEPEPHTGIGSYLASRMEAYHGDISKSLSSLAKSLAADPDNLHLKTQMAALYAEQSRFRQARETLSEVFAVDPDYVPALVLSGKLAARSQHLEMATDDFQHILRLEPDEDEVRMMLAEVYVARNMFTQALRELRRVQRSNPELLNAYYFEALIYTVHLKDYRRAIRAYDKILDYEPNNYKVLATIAELYEKLEEGDKAIAYLRRIQNFDPSDVTVRLRISLIYYESKRYDKAAEEFVAIQELHPESDKITYYLGVIYENTDRFNEALAEFQKIQPESDFFRDARLHQALILDKQDKRDEAIVLLEDTIDELPEESMVYEYLAELHRENKNWEATVATLKRGLRRTKLKEKFYYSLGVVYDMMDRFDDSIAAMEKVLEINPDNPNALNFVGYLYAERGLKLDEAEEMIQKALRLKPDDGYITDSLGWVYYMRGDYDQALKYLKEADRIIPNEPTVMEHLGDVHRMLGHERTAKKYYRRALKERRDNPDMIKNDYYIESLENKLANNSA